MARARRRARRRPRQFRHDNPLWSTIELADGPLTVYEIERSGTVPPTVVLASCDSGVGGARGGAQLHGLAGTLLTMGARTIVAAIGALPDTAETRHAMVDLHRDLAGGSRASASLARQRSAADGGFSRQQPVSSRWESDGHAAGSISSCTDDELIGMIRAGGAAREAAWSDMLRRHTPKMYAVAGRSTSIRRPPRIWCRPRGCGSSSGPTSCATPRRSARGCA